MATSPLRVAVVTVSDTRTLADDPGGDTLVARLEAAGFVVTDRALVRDEPEAIRATVARVCDGDLAEAIVTTGGTGIAPRDGTYEAVAGLLEKTLDGLRRGVPEALVGRGGPARRAVARRRRRPQGAHPRGAAREPERRDARGRPGPRADPGARRRPRARRGPWALGLAGGDGPRGTHDRPLAVRRGARARRVAREPAPDGEGRPRRGVGQGPRGRPPRAGPAPALRLQRDGRVRGGGGRLRRARRRGRSRSRGRAARGTRLRGSRRGPRAASSRAPPSRRAPTPS